MTGNRFSRLTDRELQIVREVAAAGHLPNREIAAKLGITESAVQRSLCSIYDKLGVSTQLELTMLVVNQDLLAMLAKDQKLPPRKS